MKRNESKAMQLARRILMGCALTCALCLMILISAGASLAQSKDTVFGVPVITDPNTNAPLSGKPVTVPKEQTNEQPSAQSDERYRIGPGDVLDIRVFNRPQLSREARVDSNGVIQMPLLEGDIRAACLTENELAKTIATLYLKYQRNPYVNVFVKEYSSTPVAVIGAVDKPGRFQLTRRVRLLELLAFAGGPTEKAGGKIQIAHTGIVSLCEAPDAESENIFDFYSLRDSMKGSKESNPFIRAGDIISIPEADQAYVVGNVYKPQAVLLKEPVTVSQAIAMAGGTLRASKLKAVRIVRPKKDSTSKDVILVDLEAINKQRAPDILLEPNDVIQVPTNEGKIMTDKILNGLTGGLSAVIYKL
jgi:polysaccharide export outer membrane protein